MKPQNDIDARLRSGRMPGRAMERAMVRIRDERPGDAGEREQLLDLCFGVARFRKTCEKFRRRRLPANRLSLIAECDGLVVGTVRLWHVEAGPGRSALLLGPLAVDPAYRDEKIGARLMESAIARARSLGHDAILLVGDAPYYQRFGFSAAPVSGLSLPGPYERDRFLALELVPGALDGARGMVVATGRIKGKSRPMVMETARAA